MSSESFFYGLQHIKSTEYSDYKGPYRLVKTWANPEHPGMYQHTWEVTKISTGKRQILISPVYLPTTTTQKPVLCDLKEEPQPLEVYPSDGKKILDVQHAQLD